MRGSDRPAGLAARRRSPRTGPGRDRRLLKCERRLHHRKDVHLGGRQSPRLRLGSPPGPRADATTRVRRRDPHLPATVQHLPAYVRLVRPNEPARRRRRAGEIDLSYAGRKNRVIEKFRLQLENTKRELELVVLSVTRHGESGQAVSIGRRPNSQPDLTPGQWCGRGAAHENLEIGLRELPFAQPEKERRVEYPGQVGETLPRLAVVGPKAIAARQTSGAIFHVGDVRKGCPRGRGFAEELRFSALWQRSNRGRDGSGFEDACGGVHHAESPRVTLSRREAPCDGCIRQIRATVWLNVHSQLRVCRGVEHQVGVVRIRDKHFVPDKLVLRARGQARFPRPPN